MENLRSRCIEDAEAFIRSRKSMELSRSVLENVIGIFLNGWGKHYKGNRLWYISSDMEDKILKFCQGTTTVKVSVEEMLEHATDENDLYKWIDSLFEEDGDDKNGEG